MADELLAERYELGDVIGRGGLGVVRRARDVVLDRDVAIKAMREDLAHDEDLVRRLDEEARSAASLTHPNAVVLFDVLRVDDRTHLVMELVDGVPLPACRRDGRLPADLAALVARDVAAGLGAAHARGIVHRDVKPSNVMVTREGHVKLSDFGIATAIGASGTRITTVGTVIGSAAYLAPEQLLDDPVDGRSDVYALGLLLGELLTGSLGFGDGTWNEVMTRRLARSPSPPSERIDGVPAELDRLVVAMTEREPDDRPDAEQVVALLGPLVPRDARDRLARLVPAATAGEDDPAPTALLNDAGAQTRVVDTPESASAAVPEPPPRKTTDELVGLGPSRRDRTPTEPTDAVEGDDAAAGATAVLGSAPHRAPDAAAAGDDVPAAPVDATDDDWVGLDEEPSSRRVADPVLRSVLLGALALAFVVGIIGLVVAGGGSDGGEDPDPAATSSAPAEDGGDGGDDGVIPVTNAFDLDPLGDGEEHPEDLAALFDGDPQVVWETENYDQPDLGGTKPGVGVVLDLGEPQAVETIEIVIADDGVEFGIWAATEDPAGRPAPEVGEQVAAIPGGGAGTVTVEADGTEARWWIVWITRVETGRATIGEVTFR